MEYYESIAMEQTGLVSNLLNNLLMSSPTTNVTSRPAYFKPDVIVQISTINDFPDPVSGVITLDTNTCYEINVFLVTSNRFVVSTDALVEIVCVATSITGIISTGGAQTLFTVTEPNVFVMQKGIYVDAITTGTFVDLSATAAVSGVSFDRMALLDFRFVGNITNSFTASLTVISQMTLDNEDDGFHFGSNNSLKISQTFGGDMNAGTGGTYFSLDGTSYGSVTITDSDLNTIGTGQSYIFVNPSATVGIGNVTGAAFQDSGGATFFRPGKSGTISAFSDNGSGGTTVTDTAHGLGNNVQVTISGTTNYNGTFTATLLTANTFDINTAFVADDATGSWTSPASIDQDDVDWQFLNNGDTLDSAQIADMTLDASTVVTISVSGTPVIVGGDWSSNTNRRFDFVTSGPGNGRLTYRGLQTRQFILTGILTMVASGLQETSAVFFVNGSEIARSESSTEGNKPLTVTPHTLVTLTTDDFVEVAVINNTSTSNITVSRANITVSSPT